MEHGPSFIDNEEIHEITVGTDPKNDLRFTVGRIYMKDTSNETKVTAIVFDQNMLIQHSKLRVIVYGITKGGEEKVWKDLIDVPVTITSKV